MRFTVPRGTQNVNQLHEELLVAFPSWRGTRRPDGDWGQPLLDVESTDTEIRFTVPDGTDPALVQAVIAAHVPGPTPAGRAATRRIRLRDELSAKGFSDALRDFLVP